LPNFGKFSHFVSVVKDLDKIFVRVVGGLGCGWAKLNVVFLCRQVCWQNTSFNFAKRWHFVFHFSVRLLSVVSSFRVSANVPALGEVANFRTDYFLIKIKFLAKCKREFTTVSLVVEVFLIDNVVHFVPCSLNLSQKYKIWYN